MTDILSSGLKLELPRVLASLLLVLTMNAKSQDVYIYDIKDNGAPMTLVINGTITTVTYTEHRLGAALSSNFSGTVTGEEDCTTPMTGLQYRRQYFDNNLAEIKHYIAIELSFNPAIAPGSMFSLRDIDGSSTNNNREFASIVGSYEDNVVRPGYTTIGSKVTPSIKTLKNIPSGFPLAINDTLRTYQSSGDGDLTSCNDGRGSVTANFAADSVDHLFFLFGLRDEVGGEFNGVQKIEIKQNPFYDISILPIELVSFDAELVSEGVKLDRTTASELNNDYFTIQRSTNGQDRDNIGQVDGTGNSQQTVDYSFVDKDHTLSGTVYYRLVQTDYDGTEDISNTIAIKVEVSAKESFVYPNPVRAGENINISHYELYDLLGRLVGKNATNNILLNNITHLSTVQSILQNKK